MEILKGHISPETAFIVNDYPYGFTLRCKIRYWLEYHPPHGIRLCSQTTNPKRPDEVWNKPKCSTYSRYSGCMYLNELNHVTWSGLSEYSDYKEALEWKEKFFEGVPELAREKLNNWIEAKRRYKEKMNDGLDYQKAGRETVIEMMKEGIKI